MFPEINFQRTPVTLILTAVVIAIEVVCTLNPGMRNVYYSDYRLGILSYIWAGELWRPFTTALLHGGLLHAAFNAYWLLIFGTAIENRFGSWPTLGLIVLLAYMSMMPEFLYTNYETNVGAQIKIVGMSGVVYGLFGLMWVTRSKVYQFALICNERVVMVLLGWFVFCIIATRFDILPVANIAHFFGLVFGALYGKAIFDGKRNKAWRVGAVAATLIVLATLFYAPGHAGYEHRRQIRALQSRLAASENSDAIARSKCSATGRSTS